MALTSLDAKAALLVIDLQQGIAGMPTVRPIAAIAEAAAPLLVSFRHHDLPVVLVNVAGTPPGRSEQDRVIPQFPAEFTALLPTLQACEADLQVTKKSWGAFTGTGLNEQLQARGVTQVLVLGVSTSIGVESTARQAHELGYNVVVVTDAITDTSVEAHENSCARIFPRLGETCTVADVLAKLS